MLDDLTSSKARIKGNLTRGSKNSKLNHSGGEDLFTSKDNPLSKGKNTGLNGQPRKQSFGV